MLPYKLTNTIRKKQYYEFSINNNIANKKHINNRIDTSKYNIATFLPKALLYQFVRLANVYFLITAIIQCIPEISPLSPVTAIAPLCFVLIVSLIREAIEDIMRHRYDSLQNNEQILVYSPKEGSFVIKPSSDICVGEIVYIEENMAFPADMILIDSNLDEGFAYIATGTLDGEKTLKIKNAYKTTVGFFRKEDGKGNGNGNGDKDMNMNTLFLNKGFSLSGELMCDMPNSNLFKFEGTVRVDYKNDNVNISNAYFPVNLNQLMLKGAVLKQTKWIIGIVVYTGNNSKIILNSKSGVVKYTRIEKLMSRLLIAIFIFQFILCLICAVFHYVFYIKNINYFIFTGLDMRNVTKDSILIYFTYLLLLNTMIPISLIVTIEIVKGIQAYFINKDIAMYSFERQVFAKAGSITLNEELGNIDYIFTDKTGTLTCNKMMFKYCIIGDVCYEYIREENKGKVRQSMYKDVLSDNMKITKENRGNDNKDGDGNKIDNMVYLNCPVRSINNYIHNEEENIKKSNNKDSAHDVEAHTTPNAKNIITPAVIYKTTSSGLTHNYDHLLKDMSIKPIGPLYMEEYVNHCTNPIKYSSMLIQSLQDPHNTYLQIPNDCTLINEYWKCLALAHECVYSNDEYSGVSPDDIELVKMAKEQGYQFLKSGNTYRRLKINQIETEYEVLSVLPFSSERKRMSIIIKDNNIIKVYTKGADSEITKRLGKHSPKYILDKCSSYVNTFSSIGYRTLFVAMKILSQAEYDKLISQLTLAELAFENKHFLIAECYHQIESNLFLLGATIVEDKLQDKVPETIRDLRLAGIKIWMLTGDKIDTAENIALSCNLISQSLMKNFRIIKNNKVKLSDNAINSDNSEIEKFFREYQQFSYDEAQKVNPMPYSITIESSLFNSIFNDKELTNQFLDIAIDADSVICCRVSPLQKSQVIKAVKSFSKQSCTLAIGDGGNDVSMILEAHIGIGVYGEEGMRAVQASDIAIGEFKYLSRLLFTHGRTNNIRISEMILYFFYKNFILTIIHFFYSFYSLSSGQTIIDDWLISLFNMVFTALPLGVTAVTDFDIKEEDDVVIKKMMPFLYKENKQEPRMTKTHILLNLLLATIYSGLNFYLVELLAKSSLSSNGLLAGLWETSICLFSNILLIATERVVIIEKNHTVITPIVIFITSFLSYMVTLAIMENVSLFNSHCTVLASVSNVKFYLNMLLLFTITFMIDMVKLAYEHLFSDKLVYRLRARDFNNEIVTEKLKLYDEQNNKMAMRLRSRASVSSSSSSFKHLERIERINGRIGLQKNISVKTNNNTMQLKLTEKPMKHFNSKHTYDMISYKSNYGHYGNNNQQINNSKHLLIQHNMYDDIKKDTSSINSSSFSNEEESNKVGDKGRVKDKGKYNNRHKTSKERYHSDNKDKTEL